MTLFRVGLRLGMDKTHITLILLNLDMPCLCSVDPEKFASEEAS